MAPETSLFSPGILVRNPEHPDWGVGQVQSSIGHKVTINFEHVGKKMVNTVNITLVLIFDE